MVNVKNAFLKLNLILIPFLILLLTIKGDRGNPIAYQKEQPTKVGTPFESSNSTSRYALTEAIVENHSLSFTNKEAKFATPDLVYYRKKFYTIFTPGVSFVGVPFYMIGKLFSVPQLFTYFSVSLMAFINMFLIASLARKLGVNQYAAYLGGLIFLFATNGIVYANTYTQHHMTTMLLLLALHNALGERTALRNLAFGAIAGLAVLADLPNVVLLFPVGIYILLKHFSIQKAAGNPAVTLRTSLFILLIGLLPFVSLFAWYNKQTTGSFAKTGQTIGRSDYDTVFGKKPKKVIITSKSLSEEHDSFFPFKSRLQLQGLDVLLISNERSWLYYSPVILLGILGFISLYKEGKKTAFANILLSIVGVNIVLYSMFGDPWGGWAFGPRYLIPAAAMMACMTGVAIQRYYKNIVFTLLFFLTFVYSTFISILGVLTTAAIPPKQEATSLVNPLPYTYDYNLQQLDANKVSSLVYNLVLRNTLNGYIYLFFIVLCIISICISVYTLHIVYERRLHSA